jgi:hypothetical protein
MTIDGGDNIYVNSIAFGFSEMGERLQNPSKSPAGVVALITPDGTARKVPMRSPSQTAWSSRPTTRR